MLILLIPIILLVLALMTVGLLLFKKWKWALVCAICCFALNWWTETFPLNLFHSANVNERDLRVAAYNIDCLGWGEKHEGWEKELVDFVEEIDADILFLSEFQYHDFGNYTHLLDTITKTKFYKKVVDVKYGRKDVVYSKYPIESFHRIDINPKFCESDSLYKEITVDYYQKLMPMIYQMVVNVKGKDIQLVCCHLASNEFNVAKKAIREKGVGHFWDNLNKGYLFREIEANSIVEALDKSMPTILMGDLNDINGSTTLSILKNAGLKDAWWESGCGSGHTYYKQGLYFRLDHIMTSEDIDVLDVNVPHCQASDHYPIVAELKIIEHANTSPN